MYLMSTHKIAIASLDGRGTTAAGDKLKFEIYRNMSMVEVEDQIIAGRCVCLIVLLSDNFSALEEVSLYEMRCINLRFTYLFTYLLTTL